MTDTTGVSTDVTTPSGGTVTPGPAPSEPVAPPAQAGDASLQAQLDEQRTIQGGLQRRINQLEEQLRLTTQERDEARTQADEAAKSTVTATEELATLKQQVPGLEAQLSSLQEQVNAQGATAKRAEIVATRFPQLAPLLDAGGLPAFTSEEEFTTKAQGIVDALNLTAGQQYQQQAAGTRPPVNPPAGSQPSKAEVGIAYQKAVEEGKWDEAEKLRSQWHDMDD